MTGRVRLHVRVAEMMEAVYGSNSESHAAELAYHYSLGAMLAGPEKWSITPNWPRTKH